MALRYYFEFNNEKGELYRGEIHGNTSEPAKQVQGRASIQYDLSDNPLQTLWIKSCNISLLATIDEPLDDIYNEEDRFWRFTLQKNGSLEFQGYITTEDMEQSYSSSKWLLNFEALGHLGFLENNGYYDSSGLPYTGRESIFNIIANCLEKGYNPGDPKLFLFFNHYLEAKGGGDIYKNTHLDQGQFYDEDGEAEDCRDIIEDVLKSLGCVMVQNRFAYHIFPALTWAKLLTENIVFTAYTGDLVQIPDQTLNYSDDDQRIGQEGSAKTYHISQNQRYLFKKYYSKVRIRHDFDYAPQIMPNGELLSSGNTMPDWTLTAESDVPGDYIRIDGKELVSEIALAATSFPISLKKNDELEFEILAEYITDPTEQTFEILLSNTPSGTDYSYSVLQSVEGADAEVEWVALPVGGLVQKTVEFSPTEGELTHTIEVAPLPEDGDLTFNAYTGIFGSAHNATSKTLLKHVKVKAKTQPIEAEEFTYTHTGKTKGAVPDVYEVRFNTSDRNILRNIFFDSAGNAMDVFKKSTATTSSVDELARVILAFHKDNYKVFTGDVRNNFGFSIKRVDNVGGPFMVVSENRDLSSNISSLKLVEVGTETPSHTKEVARKYKEAVKPTIKS